MEEKWRPIRGYEGLYEISNKGRVKSLTRMGGNNYTQLRPERILKRCIVQGYWTVGLCKKGKVNYCKVHRLVAIAFLPNPEGKPQINHKDGNKKNARVTNLEWATHRENTEHAVKTNLSPKGERNPAAKLRNEQVLEIYERRLGTERIRDLAKEYKIDVMGVIDIWSGRRWRHVTGATKGNKDWKGRRKRGGVGERNCHAKLTIKQVRKIKRLNRKGVSCAELGRMYGVARQTISRIIRGTSWKENP